MNFELTYFCTYGDNKKQKFKQRPTEIEINKFTYKYSQNLFFNNKTYFH